MRQRSVPAYTRLSKFPADFIININWIKYCVLYICICLNCCFVCFSDLYLYICGQSWILELGIQVLASSVRVRHCQSTLRLDRTWIRGSRIQEPGNALLAKRAESMFIRTAFKIKITDIFYNPAAKNHQKLWKKFLKNFRNFASNDRVSHKF